MRYRLIINCLSITHLSTHFAAATVSSFEATFLFYPLPFEKHIPFHKITFIRRIPRNSSFPNSWDWQNFRHDRQWPSSITNDLERLITWAPYTYRRCKWSWQQGELLCCFDFLVPCANPVQTLDKPQARKNGSGNAVRPLCVSDPHITREGQPQW